MKSLLPVIFVVLLLTGAITFALSKRVIPKREENRFGIAANELKAGSSDTVTPTPSLKVTPTPSSPKVTPTPTIVIKTIAELPASGQKGGSVEGNSATPKVTKTTKTIICTPVYGQANTCTEHIVVDTGASDAIFFNFAGLSYLAGLASFVFAKRS